MTRLLLSSHLALCAAGKLGFAAVGLGILRFFKFADILGYNALNFDIPFLAAEVKRARLPARTPGCILKVQVVALPCIASICDDDGIYAVTS